MNSGPPTQHILSELGFAVSQADADLVGVASIIPEMCVPGLPRLRTSILAAWADHLSGLLAITVMAPLVPVTLELDVHLFAPAPGSGTVRCTAKALKAGRSVFMASVTFTSDDGDPIAVGGGSFMVAPDPSLRLPSTLSLNGPPPVQSLRVPLGGASRLRVPRAGRRRAAEVGGRTQLVQHRQRGTDRARPPRKRRSRWHLVRHCRRSASDTCGRFASDPLSRPRGPGPGSGRSRCVTPVTRTVSRCSPRRDTSKADVHRRGWGICESCA